MVWRRMYKQQHMVQKNRLQRAVRRGDACVCIRVCVCVCVCVFRRCKVSMV
jgi:hypothetical protein